MNVIACLVIAVATMVGRPMEGQQALVGEAVEARLRQLVGKMTLEEKVGQLVQVRSAMSGGAVESVDATGKKVSSVLANRIRQGEIGTLIGSCGIERYNLLQKIAVEESRLGIPLMVGHDLIHGVMTQFPIPLALSCAWDEQLWEDCGRLIAREAPIKGCNWTFAPMCDIARDARWGRIAEGMGQDPLLSSRMTAAMVKGIQSGEGAIPIAACLKHYLAYGACEGGRDYNTVELGESTLRNIYLPPFVAGVKAGALTVMPGFNVVNGIPVSVNRWLLRDILRSELGFRGFTISDWAAIQECGVNGHGVAESDVELARQAIAAGMDQDMLSEVYGKELVGLVRRGEVDEKLVDESVLNVLRVKAALGLWEKPYIDEKAAQTKVDLKTNAELARKVAAKSFVLLKNGEEGPLPLKANSRVALVGPGLEDVENLRGCWSRLGSNFVNCRVTEGLSAAGVEFKHVKGYDFRDGAVDVKGMEGVIAESDVIVAAFGEYGNDSGEGCSYVRIELSEVQREAIKALKATGKPLVALVFGGRPLAIPELAEAADAILVVWSPGTSAGEAIADVLTGKVAPEGRLTTEMPYDSASMPLYYNILPTGRPAPYKKDKFVSCYRDRPYWALYPFGSGIGYTSFAYTNEMVEVSGGIVKLSAEVINTGKRRGVETVQAYTRQVIGAESRPIRELKGWKKVELAPGEKRWVEIEISIEELSYWAGGERRAASGRMMAWICHDSVSGRKLEFQLPSPLAK